MTSDCALFLDKGYHYCAFPSACYKPAKKYVKTSWKKNKLDALGYELKELSNCYDLDYTRLSNEELIL